MSSTTRAITTTVITTPAVTTPAVTTTATAPTSRGRVTGTRAAVGRRWPTGVGVVVAAVGVAAMAPVPAHVRPWVGAWWVLVAAVIYLTWGTARGELGERRWLTAQTAGVLGFGAVSIAVVAVDSASASYVLAAGWLAHAVWDVLHHRADRVVPRWYAEACLVTDVTVAAVLLTAGLV